MNQICKKITISGKVQGVGYRYWLQKLCKKNKIKGWVKNKKNGEVEAAFYDLEDEMFKNVLSNCFIGPTKAQVTNILVEDLTDGVVADNFEIIN